MIETIIDLVVENPTEENKNQYEQTVNLLEYSLIQEAELLPYKSQEYFDKRTEAFSVRSKCAKMMLTKWVSKFGSTDGCPVKYESTLNIPFRQIKKT
jgi:hypothetical protein